MINEAEARFKAIGEAYDVLKDPQKRAAYDQYGKAAFENGGGQGGDPFGGFSDIFDSIFGDFTGRGRQRGPQRGADLRYDMEISLEEAYHGKETEFSVEVSVGCDPCGGSGAKPGKIGLRNSFLRKCRASSAGLLPSYCIQRNSALLAGAANAGVAINAVAARGAAIFIVEFPILFIKSARPR